MSVCNHTVTQCEWLGVKCLRGDVCIYTNYSTAPPPPPTPSCWCWYCTAPRAHKCLQAIVLYIFIYITQVTNIITDCELTCHQVPCLIVITDCQLTCHQVPCMMTDSISWPAIRCHAWWQTVSQEPGARCHSHSFNQSKSWGGFWHQFKDKSKVWGDFWHDFR